MRGDRREGRNIERENQTERETGSRWASPSSGGWSRPTRGGGDCERKWQRYGGSSLVARKLDEADLGFNNVTDDLIVITSYAIHNSDAYKHHIRQSCQKANATPFLARPHPLFSFLTIVTSVSYHAPLVACF